MKLFINYAVAAFVLPPGQLSISFLLSQAKCKTMVSGHHMGKLPEMHGVNIQREVKAPTIYFHPLHYPGVGIMAFGEFAFLRIGMCVLFF